MSDRRESNLSSSSDQTSGKTTCRLDSECDEAGVFLVLCKRIDLGVGLFSKCACLRAN